MIVLNLYVSCFDFTKIPHSLNACLLLALRSIKQRFETQLKHCNVITVICMPVILNVNLVRIFGQHTKNKPVVKIWHHGCLLY